MKKKTNISMKFETRYYYYYYSYYDYHLTKDALKVDCTQNNKVRIIDDAEIAELRLINVTL